MKKMHLPRLPSSKWSICPPISKVALSPGTCRGKMALKTIKVQLKSLKMTFENKEHLQNILSEAIFCVYKVNGRPTTDVRT